MSQVILFLASIKGFCSAHLPVTLLHYGYFFYDFLQVRFHRNLFNGNNLPRFFMDGFEHAAIRTRKQNIKQTLRIATKCKYYGFAFCK